MASLSDFSWCKFRGQQINHAPRRVKTRPLCDSYIMSLPCCSSLSWCYLCLLLALSSHHACSAPDFSGKFFFLRFCDTQLNIALQPHRHFPKKSVWEVTYFSHILCKIAVKCQLRKGWGVTVRVAVVVFKTNHWRSGLQFLHCWPDHGKRQLTSVCENKVQILQQIVLHYWLYRYSA